MMLEDKPLVQQQLQYIFTNNSSRDEEIYPPAISEMSEAQASHHICSKYFKDKPVKNKDSRICPKVIDGIRVLTFENKLLAIPTNIQHKVIP